MASSYPAVIDEFGVDPISGQALGDLHRTHHINIPDAVEKIEAELGTNPKGNFPSVKERMAGSIGAVIHGAVNNVARPVGFAKIEWTGSVEPINALDNDTWVVTS